jgi:hypothetical protein
MFDEGLGLKAREDLGPKSAQRPSWQLCAVKRDLSTGQREPGWTASWNSIQQVYTPSAETAFDDERECAESYALAGRSLGGGLGTSSIVMSGWPIDGTSTEPMAKRAAAGRLGVW